MLREITFCELRQKDVINVTDGKSLGCIVDLVLDYHTGLICGLVVPGEHKFFNFFKCEQLFVPWQNICKIGEDVILVELFDAFTCSSPTVNKLGVNKEDAPSKNYGNSLKNSKNNMESYDSYEIYAKKSAVPEIYRVYD
jgi:YlmC/YmxH family sporulation protein